MNYINHSSKSPHYTIILSNNPIITISSSYHLSFFNIKRCVPCCRFRLIYVKSVISFNTLLITRQFALYCTTMTGGGDQHRVQLMKAQSRALTRGRADVRWAGTSEGISLAATLDRKLNKREALRAGCAQPHLQFIHQDPKFRSDAENDASTLLDCLLTHCQKTRVYPKEIFSCYEEGGMSPESVTLEEFISVLLIKVPAKNIAFHVF